VFDLNDQQSDMNDYMTDWNSIANWFMDHPAQQIICDGRMLSSYRHDYFNDEGKNLTENYYYNLKQHGGGLLLATDDVGYQSGINVINELIGLNPFTGTISASSTMIINNEHPILHVPNDLGNELINDSGGGIVPIGNQPSGILLHPVALHNENSNTPGISSTISEINIDPIPTNTSTPVPTTQSESTPLEAITIDIPNLPEGAKPLVMVRIPAGTFLMGLPTDERGRNSDYEWLSHQVTISKDFYIGKYEVTQAQWEAKMKYNSSYKGTPAETDPTAYGIGPNYPAYFVSWDDCHKFIEQLNQSGQGTFRLPTEAEWEYACRAGTQTRYYWGDDLNETEINNYCWYNGNGPNRSKEVGQKIANVFGLYDMCGNIYEWCSDRWEYPTERGNQVDPQGPSSGWERVKRGGDWLSQSEICRSANRDYHEPDGHYHINGIRLARDVDFDNTSPVILPTPKPSNTPTATPTPTLTPQISWIIRSNTICGRIRFCWSTFI